MPIENFTVTDVNFLVTENQNIAGVQPNALITLTPDFGYQITATDFGFQVPVPTAINQNASFFQQNGANVELIAVFTNPTLMPSNNLEIPLCISGFATEIGFSISGSVNINTSFSTPLEQIVPYSNTGELSETEVVFTETITADTNYYFFTEPAMGITTGNAANYAITNSKVYNIDNQLTSITFSVSYTYPNADVTGDLLQINATAIPIIVATDYVNAYNIDQSTIPANGDTRVLSLIGDPGSVFTVILNEIGTGNATTLANNVTMPATGTYSIPGITFPVATANADPYTIVISGDINPNIANSGADVLLNFTQLAQVTFTIQATATGNISGGTNVYEFIAVPNYTYAPGETNTLDFRFKASSLLGPLSIISTVDANSFSPVIPDPAYPATLYSIGSITQGIDIAGVFVVDGTITIQTTQDDSILHTLDLNTIVQAGASTAPFLYTTVITNTTSTTATSGGNSINDYGSAITAKGVQWSTTSNFATIQGSTSDGTGSSNYSSAITGLTATNTYFVRAYATNAIGTGYGQVTHL